MKLQFITEIDSRIIPSDLRKIIKNEIIRSPDEKMTCMSAIVKTLIPKCLAPRGDIIRCLILVYIKDNNT